MTDKEQKIIALLIESIEEGHWVKLFEIANWLEKRATFEQKCSELLKDVNKLR